VIFAAAAAVCSFKTTGGFHSSKDAEQDANRLLFRKFKEELKVKYPTPRRCHD